MGNTYRIRAAEGRTGTVVRRVGPAVGVRSGVGLGVGSGVVATSGRDNHRTRQKNRPDPTRHGNQKALTAAAEYTVSQGIPFLSASIRCGMS